MLFFGSERNELHPTLPAATAAIAALLAALHCTEILVVNVNTLLAIKFTPRLRFSCEWPVSMLKVVKRILQQCYASLNKQHFFILKINLS